MARVLKELGQKLALPIVLQLVENGKAHPVLNNPAVDEFGNFVLPVNPQAFTPRQAARTTVHEVSRYGISETQGPGTPEWDIEGRFLLTPDKKTGLSNYGLTRALEDFILYYLEQNYTRGLERKPLLNLRLSDLFQDEHWIVEPMNVPRGSRAVGTPTTEGYSLKLKGVQPYAQRQVRSKPNVRAAAIQPANQGVVAVAQRDACPFWTGQTCSVSSCTNRVGGASE